MNLFLKMVIRKLPYIIFRTFESYGYLTDNSDFGYDTAAKSTKKRGDLLLSKEGSIFYSVLSETPQPIDTIVNRLISFFEGTTKFQLLEDALNFYKELGTLGFVGYAENPNNPCVSDRLFSYNNYVPSEIVDNENLSFTNEGVFKGDNRLCRVHLDISSRCNEDCVHCYIPSAKKTKIMDNHVFDEILSQCIDMNVINITISGGEPLLNPSLITFLRKCKEANFSINVLSNLTLLTDELIEEFESNPLISIQTSLYSMDEDIHDLITKRKGSFNKTIDSIKKLHQRNIPMQINCPIIKQNINSYEGVLKWAHQMNIEASSDYTIFGCYDYSSKNIDCRISYDQTTQIMKKKCKSLKNVREMEETSKIKKVNSDDFVCSVCKSSLCISNNGDVYPCEGWQGLVIGNVQKECLREIWNNNQIVHKLRNLKFKDFPKCNDCSNKRYCSNCLIVNANDNPRGDFMTISPYQCELADIKKRCVQNALNDSFKNNSV